MYKKIGWKTSDSTHESYYVITLDNLPRKCERREECGGRKAESGRDGRVIGDEAADYAQRHAARAGSLWQRR